MRHARSSDRKQWPPLIKALLCASIPAILAFAIAPAVTDAELRKVLYAGGATLLFGGLLGGVLKLLLDEVVAAQRRREDAAGFVTNVLADLKHVYDGVARARTLIPAHRSVKTYGEEMRGMIDARVQLRNVTRALEWRADGIDETVRVQVTSYVKQMEAYLDKLTEEFRDRYKELSDQQRGYEVRATALLTHFAESTTETAPPTLPNFVWNKLAVLPMLSDFIGKGDEYEAGFNSPLDKACEWLRSEHARILRSERGVLAKGS